MSHNATLTAKIASAPTNGHEPYTIRPQRPFVFQTAELTEDTPLVLRATNKRVHVGWDPHYLTHAEAVAAFHLCADSAGVDTTGIVFPAEPTTVRPRRLFVFETAELTERSPMLVSQDDRQVFVTWDPSRIDHDQAVQLFEQSAKALGIDTADTVLPFPPLRLAAVSLTAAAESVITEAVSHSLAGLETNPHDVSDQLHRAVDRAQAAHLAKVGGHTPEKAYQDSRFSSSVQAMADAMEYSADPAGTARALWTALDMVIREAAGA